VVTSPSDLCITEKVQALPSESQEGFFDSPQIFGYCTIDKARPSLCINTDLRQESYGFRVPYEQGTNIGTLDQVIASFPLHLQLGRQPSEESEQAG